MTLPITTKGYYQAYPTYSEKPTPKKIAIATASGVIPGLGQAINGQWGKGGLFLGSVIGLSLLARNCTNKGAKIPAFILALTSIAARSYAVVDSYIHSK